MFVETDERSGAAYRDFWARLNKGETQSAEYKRIDNHGREVWVQASYIPVLDSRGNPTKVIALASDITAKESRISGKRGSGFRHRTRAGSGRIQIGRHDHYRETEPSLTRWASPLAKCRGSMMACSWSCRSGQAQLIANSGPSSIAARLNRPNTGGLGKGGREFGLRDLQSDRGRDRKAVQSCRVHD